MSSELWTAVVVTAIPVVGGGVGYLIKYLIEFRNENRIDHNLVMEAISDLKTDVREVKSGLYDHISWHSKKVKK